MKIKLSEDLRANIIETQKWLQETLDADAVTRREMAESIVKAEGGEIQITKEIEQLESRLLHDETAAEKIPGLKIRQAAFHAELDRQRNGLATLPPVSLAPAVAVVREIVTHWVSKFPGEFFSLAGDLCSDEANAATVCRHTEAFNFLHQLSNRCYHLHVAGERNVRIVKTTFERALRGQAHLGRDQSQPVI